MLTLGEIRDILKGLVETGGEKTDLYILRKSGKKVESEIPRKLNRDRQVTFQDGTVTAILDREERHQMTR